MPGLDKGPCARAACPARQTTAKMASRTVFMAVPNASAATRPQDYARTGAGDQPPMLNRAAASTMPRARNTMELPSIARLTVEM